MYRKHWLLGSAVLFAPDNGAGAGGGGAGNAAAGGDQSAGGAGKQSANQSGNAGGDELENFFDANKDMWDDPVSEGDAGKGGDGKQSNNAAGDGGGSTPDGATSRLQKYLEGKSFVAPMEPEELQTFIDQRDPRGLADYINKGMRTAYGSVLQDVTRMIEGLSGRMTKEMERIAKTNITATESEKSLYDAVPLARNTAVAPVAKAIKAQFLKKGLSDADANKKVKQFISAMRDADDGDDDDGTPPRGRSGSTGNNKGRAQPDDVDWAQILGGGD